MLSMSVLRRRSRPIQSDMSRSIFHAFPHRFSSYQVCSWSRQAQRKDPQAPGNRHGSDDIAFAGLVCRTPASERGLDDVSLLPSVVDARRREAESDQRHPGSQGGKEDGPSR